MGKTKGGFRGLSSPWSSSGFSGSEMAIEWAIFFRVEHWCLGEGTGWWQGLVHSQDSGLLPSAFSRKHMEKIRKEELDIICFRQGSMYNSTLGKSREGPSGSWLCCNSRSLLCSSQFPFDKVSVKISVTPLFQYGGKSKIWMCRSFENCKIIYTCWILLRNTFFKCKSVLTVSLGS